MNTQRNTLGIFNMIKTATTKLMLMHQNRPEFSQIEVLKVL